MSVSSTGKSTSPRQQRAKLKGETKMEVENHRGSTANKDKVEAEQAKIENKVESNTNMPVPADSSNPKEAASKIQVHEEKPKTLAVSGERPIAESDLHIAHTFSAAGIRPISDSTLEVVDTMNVMGIRPIGANTIHVIDTMNLSGIRPIASSTLVISDNYSVMGNRPVASNNTEDSEINMGYLD